MSGAGQDVVIVVTDEGLGGVSYFARTIRSRGLRPVLITPPGPAHREVQWHEVFDEILYVDDPYDWGTLVKTVRAAFAPGTVRGMLSAYDGVVISTSRAARSLGLACPTVAGLERARDKHATRAWSERAGLPTPPFALMSGAEQAGEVVRKVGLPAIIKPLNGTASHCVRKIESTVELAQMYLELAARVGASFPRHYRQQFVTFGVDGRFDPRRTFLVERFVPGTEYSADIIVRQGKVEHVVLLEKFLVDPVNFYEYGFVWPPAVPEEREQAIRGLIEATVHALGVDNAMAHVEVIDGPDGPVIVEVNAGRLGGLLVGPMAWHVTGINLAEEQLSLALGQGQAAREQRDDVAPIAGLTVFLPHAGRVDEIRGVDQVAELPGVIEVMQLCAVGDEAPLTDHEIPGLGVLVGGHLDRSELASLYARILGLVSFDMTEPATA